MPKRTRKREWEDDYTLLCERCGYILEGLDTATPCPECAKPITESLPERRIGTPWQQNPGFTSMVKTWWMTLRHPLHTLDVMRFDDRGDTFPLMNSLILTGLVCSILTAASALPAFMISLGWSISLLVLCCPIITVFFAFSAIEAQGLKFFGKSRGFRIGPHVAWAIVGHGAVGWLLTGLVWTVGIYLFRYKLYLDPTPSHSNSSQNELSSHFIHILGQTLFPSIVVGFVIGLFVFELFAYFGLRRCKYANRIRPYKQQDPATGLVESVESEL